MWVYLFAFYGFGLPASWYFTFTAEVGLMGVWFGITLGGVIVNVAFLKNILNTDWDK
jgi:Na+-driven multidrug efflux pump